MPAGGAFALNQPPVGGGFPGDVGGELHPELLGERDSNFFSVVPQGYCALPTLSLSRPVLGAAAEESFQDLPGSIGGVWGVVQLG